MAQHFSSFDGENRPLPFGGDSASNLRSSAYTPHSAMIGHNKQAKQDGGSSEISAFQKMQLLANAKLNRPTPSFVVSSMKTTHQGTVSNLKAPSSENSQYLAGTQVDADSEGLLQMNSMSSNEPRMTRNIGIHEYTATGKSMIQIKQGVYLHNMKNYSHLTGSHNSISPTIKGRK